MKITRWLLREHEGERIKPPWMGLAYYDFDTDVEHLRLIPFNYVIAQLRNLYSYVRYRYYPLRWEAEKKKVYQAGFRAGINWRVRYTPEDQ